MDIEELQKEYVLQQHKGRVQAALDSSQGMIEFSKMSLRGATILNGAAAVAILYSKQVWWYSAALWFAGGAFCAVLATGVAYLTQWLLFETWRPALMGGVIKISPATTEHSASQGANAQAQSTALRLRIEENPPLRAVRWAGFARWCPTLLVLCSFVFFALGLKDAYDLLDQRPAIAAEGQATAPQSASPSPQ